MKKYKLLKDLPLAKAGTICVIIEEIVSIDMTRDYIVREFNDSMMGRIVMTSDELGEIRRTGKFDEWFEEIDESKVWRPNTCEQYYYIKPDCEICSEQNDNSPFDINAIAIGNCFKTRKDAKEAVEKLRALRELHERGFKFTNLSTSIHEKCDYFDISAGIDNISGEDWGFVTSRMKTIFAEAEANYE